MAENFSNYNPYSGGVISKTFTEVANDDENHHVATLLSVGEAFAKLHGEAHQWVQENHAVIITLQTHSHSINGYSSGRCRCFVTVLAKVIEEKSE